jgi:hypothetical protein
MRTRVRPGGATSVRGGPAETAADVAGAVRALEGVGPSVRPSWGPSVVVVVVVVVVVCGASDDGALIVAAAAATSSTRRGRILACSTAYVELHIADCLRASQGLRALTWRVWKTISIGEVVRGQHMLGSSSAGRGASGL